MTQPIRARSVSSHVRASRALLAIGVASAAIALLPVSLRAQVVTITISGHTTTNTGTGIYQTMFPVGSAYTSILTVNLSDPDLDGRSSVGLYSGSTSHGTGVAANDWGFTTTINGYTFSQSHVTGQFTIYNNSTYGSTPIDGIVPNFGSDGTGKVENGVTFGGQVFYLYSSNTGLFTTDAFSSVYNASISDFDVLSGGGGSNINFSGSGSPTLEVNVSSYSVSAIPEPSTYALCGGVGVFMMAWWYRRRTPVAH